MSLVATLQKYQDDIAQCNALISNSHQQNNGTYLLPELDRQQITVAAFLNCYIAWEEFLESAFVHYLTGAVSINGHAPIKYASPPTFDSAKNIITGINKYFDYGNIENVVKIAKIFFQDGAPFLIPLNSASTDLQDLRTMRNSAAHITTSTQVPLESLALRLLARPAPGITLYQLLTSSVPNRTNITVFEKYTLKLVATATVIANG